MNKLIFSEGGQPVCLDDLKTLQDMIVETIKPLLLALVKTNVFILGDYDFINSEIDTEKMQTKFILSAGTLVVDGDFLSWPDTPLAIDNWNQPIYICVKNKEEDVRTFEDGQNRNCTQSKEVYASTDSTGADQAYNLYNLHPLLDLLSSALGLGSIKENAKVTFFNGYSGKVKVNEVDNDRQLTINISTSAKSWDTSDGAISKGNLFKFDDSKDSEYLQGKVSPTFDYLGKKYQLAVCAKPVAPVVLLQPEGGFPKDFYDDSYEFPIIPVSVTFKYSEFKSFSKYSEFKSDK